MPIERLEVSRRQVLAAGLGLGGAFLLSACTAAVGQNKSGASGSGSAGKPVSGGTLKVAIPDDLIPANLFTNSNAAITTLIGFVYESLVRYPNDKLDPQPRLATDWKLADDGLSITLNLRKGVKFHTGREFTSKDVAFSLKTWADPSWRAQQNSSFQTITDIDATDPYVAVLHLAHPISNLFDILDTAYILDSETFGQFKAGKSFVGTGPFKFTSWTPNTELVYTKNEAYWLPGKPYLDGIHVAVTPDANALLSAIKSGQADLVESLAFRDAATLAKDPRFTVLELVGAEDQIYVGTNLQIKPLDDKRVRQAIAYAIDRERIISEVFQNSGYPINLPWPKYSPAYDEQKNKTYGYDPDKAKALIAEVGTEIPELTYTFQNTPVYAATAQIVQSNLADIGIKTKLDPVDNATFVSQLIGAKFPGIWTTYHSWAQHTPSTLTVSAYPFNAAHNASHYVDAAYSADADAAWKVPDGTSDAAKAAYAKVSDDLLDGLFLIEIGVVQLQYVHSSRLQGVSYTKRNELDVTNAYFS